MNKLLIPNTCQVPNVIFDKVMARVSNSSLRVLFAILRFTYGFQKRADKISLGQLEKMTGLSRQGVVNGIKGLGALVIIKKGNQAKRESNEYALNLDIATGALVNVVDQSTNLTSQKDSKRLVNVVDTPNPYTKPNNGASKKRPRTHHPEDTDSRVNPLLASFIRKYQESAGAPYVVKRGEDPALLKRLLTAGCSVEAIESAMDRFFADPYYRRIGFDVGVFCKAFNRLNSIGTKKKHDYERDAFPALQ